MVTEALAIRESSPPVIVPRSLDEMISLAERLATSQLLPAALRGKVPDVLMQIMAGQELGLYSMASLRSFHIIEGKPTMAADAMVAVVLGSGKAEYFRRVGEGSADSVTYETKRRGEPAQRCTWTKQMAKEAGLFPTKDNWRLFTRAMLASRAKSELARDVYPDVLAGCYTVDEVRDSDPVTPHAAMRDEPREEVQDAEFVDAPVAPAFDASQFEEIGEISETWDEVKLKEIASRFSKRGLKPGHPAYDAVNTVYKAQLAEIKAKRPTKAPASAAVASGSEAATSAGSETPSAASTGEG